jgi:hypothetical protein
LILNDEEKKFRLTKEKPQILTHIIQPDVIPTCSTQMSNQLAKQQLVYNSQIGIGL